MKKALIIFLTAVLLFASVACSDLQLGELEQSNMTSLVLGLLTDKSVLAIQVMDDAPIGTTAYIYFTSDTGSATVVTDTDALTNFYTKVCATKETTSTCLSDVEFKNQPLMLMMYGDLGCKVKTGFSSVSFTSDDSEGMSITLASQVTLEDPEFIGGENVEINVTVTRSAEGMSLIISKLVIDGKPYDYTSLNSFFTTCYNLPFNMV